MGKFAVQIVLGGTLLLCMGIAIAFFVKMGAEKKGRKVLLRFLGIEVAMLILVMAAFWVFLGPIQNIAMFIVLSVIVTMLANLPLAIVAKIIGVCVGRRRC